MPTKIRLQRFGKKGQPFYRIVVADSRAPRDGRFIENIGIYNPLTIPATIQIDAERALHWLQVGAQPTETARAILSYKGILYKHHLQKGILKGALSQEQADLKFNAWVEEKEQKIAQKIKDKDLAQKDVLKKKLQDEAKIKEDKAKEIAEKRAKEAASKMKVSEEQVATDEEVTIAEEAIQEAATPTDEEVPAAEEEVQEETIKVEEETVQEDNSAIQPETEEKAAETEENTDTENKNE